MGTRDFVSIRWRVGAFAVALFATGVLLHVLSIYALGHGGLYLGRAAELLVAAVADLVLAAVGSGVLFVATLLRVRKTHLAPSRNVYTIGLCGALTAIGFWLPSTLDIMILNPDYDQSGSRSLSNASLGASWILLVIMPIITAWWGMASSERRQDE